MRLPTKQRTTADDVRRVALAALATALEDRKEEAKRKPGLTGVRAVATGAVIYTAGRAAFTGRRFIRDRFGSDSDEPEAERDEEPEDEEYDEPEAEMEEEPEEEEEYEEPRAEEEEDEEPEDEEREEPRAEEEEDDDYDEDEGEDEEEAEPPRRSPSRRPPAHAKRDPEEAPDIDLPPRPSRSRAPVGRT